MTPVTHASWRQRRACLSGLLGLAIAPSLVAETSARAPRPEFSRRYSAAAYLLTRLASLHERKRDIGPLGWLAQNPEPGQSFAEFARALGPSFEPSRNTVYVVGIGDFPAGRAPLLDTASSFLAGFFGLGSKRLEDLSLGKLPRRARRQHPTHGHLQYHAGSINSLLLSRGVPSNAAAVIGLTNVDLWPGGNWNFVFGLSSLTQRVGVWSLARLGDPTRENVVSTRFLWRTVRTAVHECGHLLGMRHCTAYECGMNGANGLQEFDMQPLEFCPECQAKIVLVSGADPKQRYQWLADFATRFRMPAEASYWRSAQQVLSAHS